MDEDTIISQCLAEDIESVSELWLAADASASVKNTSDDLLQTIDSRPSSVILALTGNGIVGSIIASFDGWRGNIHRQARGRGGGA